MKRFVCLMMVALLVPSRVPAQDLPVLRKQRDTLHQRGMWRESLAVYQEKLAGAADDQAARDLRVAVQALGELSAWSEFDDLVEHAVATHPADAALLASAALAYQQAPHSGRLIAGVFARGDDAGGLFYDDSAGGPDAEPDATSHGAVDTSYRDHVRSLQLLRQATTLNAPDAKRHEIWLQLADLFKERDAWQLQALTPTESLPQWGEPGPEGGTEGAPWTADGPLLYQDPATWEGAKNDGERWRFALARVARHDAESAAHATLELARFADSQFGAGTLSSFGWWRNPDPDDATGILQLDTLAEDECLAKTSAGVRRFKLPPEQHFIALYRKILGHSPDAGDRLAQVFLERRQFAKARATLEQTIASHGPGHDDHRKHLLRQITGNWGRFEAVDTVAAGAKPRVPVVFRNATRINMSAAPVDVAAFLSDSARYLKSNPREVDSERIEPAELAARLVTRKGANYIGRTAVKWQAELAPLTNHADTRAELEVPLDKAGAWWITGKLTDGNEFHTLAWIVDAVVMKRQVAGNLHWWVADAATGAPVPEATIDFFGYRVIERERTSWLGRSSDVKCMELSRTTDADGKVVLRPGEWLEDDYEWLAVVRHPQRQPAFFGFAGLTTSEPSASDTRDEGYGISDRPLYKPGDTVHLKFFLRNLGYAKPNDSKWAGRKGVLTVHNGRDEEVITVKNLKTDDFGAVATDVVIPAEAALGRWHASFAVKDQIAARVGFQIEEYRKPEYEVTVEAPVEPVRLGAKFTATVKAAYFHGAPVRNARVNLRVKRSSLGERWFPPWRWDWLYGVGAWWNAGATSWHPTWKRWGCMPPEPPWLRHNRWTPDELILEQTVPIGPDGTVKVEIDTAAAKNVHGDMDARYEIEARVVDASRREERGFGSVIAARKPFEVMVWTDRGYAKAGEAVEATISAATLAGKPVAGAKGTLTLHRLTFSKADRIEEKAVQSWPVACDADGRVHHAFAAPATGQYRLAVRLIHQGGDAVEGAMIFNVHGPGRTDPQAWKFGPLELVADKPSYQAGETMKLRINSDRPNAHVWLFLHINGSAGRQAKRLQLNGKSSELSVPLDVTDMPNMFVQAVTVYDGEVHTAIKQVLLPPVSRMLEVTLEPAKAKVEPQEKSSLRVTLRDDQGKPVTGTSVLTVYDKALEAITGGSNVAPIHEAFWAWKHDIYGHNDDAVPASPGNLTKSETQEMAYLGTLHGGGIFGRASGYRSPRKAFGLAPLAEAAPSAGGPFNANGNYLESWATAGLRSGDAAITRNSIDAILNNPNRTAANFQPVVVRRQFADLLKWSGTVETDANGQAEIPLEFPDNLTTWKARVWSLGKGTRVGEGTAEIITSKDLLVRLQAPRFLVARDEALLSAVVHNDHDSARTVKVSLELDGPAVRAVDGAGKTLEIAAHAEARVDWRVTALRDGEVVIRMRAATDDGGDAVERKLPVLVHGMARQDAWSRCLAPEEKSATIDVDVPEQRRPEQTKLTVRISPSIAGAVVDAIPYLAAYPHGCTEQTLNRFVPGVIAQRMLQNLKIDLAEIQAKRSNLNPQELGDAGRRAAQWQQWQNNPVFDLEEMKRMTAAGLRKLMTMQNRDGGWGWFSGYGESSYPHTTAVVVHGLLVAKANGAAVPHGMLDAGLNWLKTYEHKQVAALQWYVEREALRQAGKKPKPTRREEKAHCDAVDAWVRRVLGEAKRDSEPMLAFLYRDRKELPVYAKCLVALEHHRKDDESRRDEVMRMIAQFLKRDPENQTVHLDLQNQGYWWNWYGSEVEAHAWYLQLLATVKPKHADTRGLAKYLVNNRRHAGYWNSTRDTAYAVEAIASYFKASGEDAPDIQVGVKLDGRIIREVAVNRANMFAFEDTIVLAGDAVTGGRHSIELTKSGDGPLYANAYLEVFSLEDHLRAAGLEVQVQRKISKLIETEKTTQVPDAAGITTQQRVARYQRVPLDDGAVIASGDRLEVELIIDSKNDYEYILFSDAKAAGCETLDALSGYLTDGGLHAYMEPRDQSVDFFVRALPRGTHTLRYQLRAETPGSFHALPATATGMYAPELRGNSEEATIRVGE